LLEYSEDGEDRLKMCLFSASSVLESNALLAPKAVSLSVRRGDAREYVIAEAIDNSLGGTLPGLILRRKFDDFAR